jgi:hypothetical protein
MARETRKLQRAQTQKAQATGKGKRSALTQPMKPGAPVDPLSAGQLKALLTRLAVILGAVWVLLGSIAAIVRSETASAILIGIPALLTVLAVALVLWTLRQAKKARGVASILSRVESAEDRRAAIDELETSFKKKDTAAIFAKAQLELQEDPKKALATLEQIDLSKVMAPVADEARAQRAMIHLTQGDVSAARQLADNIDLKRHQEPRTRAMMAAVAGEAWARSGDAKKALEMLNLFDPEDEAYEQLKPQLYRALAYAHAHLSDLKGMRRDLKKLAAQDVRLLGGFLMKRTHPLLQKEAKKLIEQSGQVPRKMIIQRRP